MQIRLCQWETWERAPYFANLKVMRSVLTPLREELARSGGTLRAYLFLEDRLVFLAEGEPGTFSAILERTRNASSASFQVSDHKPLWGRVRDVAVNPADRDRLVDVIRRLPEEEGYTADVFEYPWAGGDWLLFSP